jgi:hypothetical protein
MNAPPKADAAVIIPERAKPFKIGPDGTGVAIAKDIFLQRSSALTLSSWLIRRWTLATRGEVRVSV